MPRRLHRRLAPTATAALAAVALGCAWSPSAGAAGISVSVDSPPGSLAIRPSAAASTSMTVSVSSVGSWNLYLRDPSADTPGRMDRYACPGGQSAAHSLLNPLTWAVPKYSTSGTVTGTGTDSRIASGPTTVNDTFPVDLAQTVASGEVLRAGDCYRLTLELTIT